MSDFLGVCCDLPPRRHPVPGLVPQPPGPCRSASSLSLLSPGPTFLQRERGQLGSGVPWAGVDGRKPGSGGVLQRPCKHGAGRGPRALGLEVTG